MNVRPGANQTPRIDPVEANSENHPKDHPGRRLIFMGGLDGKSEEQLADEAWQAILKWREAKARHEPFEPVLDLRPVEPEQP